MSALSLEAIRSHAPTKHALTGGISAAILLVTVWLYAPTRSFEFVNWDDYWYVVNNPLIQSWNAANLKAIATETVIRNYAPLTIFSFLIDYTFWGDWAGGYHLVNVLLHGVNAVLVFFLLKQVTGRSGLAAAVAILFAVHPVHVESVAWVSSRKGLLSGGFMLASLLCWLRADRTPKQEAWGILFLALALLCKAIAVVLPAIVLAYDVFVLRRRFLESLVRQVIPGILAVWCLLANMTAQMTILGGVRGHFEFSKLDILAVDCVLLWRYVGMLLYPADLCVLYNPATTGIWAIAILAGIAWIGVCWWLWRKRDRQPLLLFASVSWLALLFPVLNFFPITTLMNDRYLYLPSIPALALIVAGFEALILQTGDWASRRFRFVLAGSLLLLASLGLAQQTRNHLPVWRNDLALWEHAVQRVPELSVVQIQRAISLYNAGQTDAALIALDHALVHCNPDELDRERIKSKLAAWRRSDDDSSNDL